VYAYVAAGWISSDAGCQLKVWLVVILDGHSPGGHVEESVSPLGSGPVSDTWQLVCLAKWQAPEAQPYPVSSRRGSALCEGCMLTARGASSWTQLCVLQDVSKQQRFTVPGDSLDAAAAAN
jgi:hypothetical protein